MPPTENTLVVNFGRLLERWTDGRIKATPHRVIGSGRERYSVPFFYEPRIDAVIAPLRLRAADGVDAPASRPSSMAIMSGPRPRNSSNSPAWSLYGRRAARRTSRAIPRQRCETPTHVARFDPHLRTTLYFHDAIEPAHEVVLPRVEHVEAILAFGRDIGDDLSHLLVHCHAGISRSTAAMAMILAQAFPQEDEHAVVDRLLRIRPQARPNSRMIGFADELLGRNGRLTAAVNKVYARRLATRPELADVMRRLERAREVELGLGAQGSE